MVDEREEARGERERWHCFQRERQGGRVGVAVVRGGPVSLLPSSIFHYVVTLWLRASSYTLISLHEFNCACMSASLFCCVNLSCLFLPALRISAAGDTLHLSSSRRLSQDTSMPHIYAQEFFFRMHAFFCPVGNSSPNFTV